MDSNSHREDCVEYFNVDSIEENGKRAPSIESTYQVSGTLIPVEDPVESCHQFSLQVTGVAYDNLDLYLDIINKPKGDHSSTEPSQKQVPNQITAPNKI